MNTRLDPVRDAVVLPAVPESVASARAWMADWFAGQGIEPLRTSDANLILSELVTNVIRHGAGDVVCHASMTDDARCCLAIIDLSRSPPRVVSRDASTVGGLGLHVVERLAADWGVTSFPGGKAVWAVVDIGSGATHPT